MGPTLPHDPAPFTDEWVADRLGTLSRALRRQTGLPLPEPSLYLRVVEAERTRRAWKATRAELPALVAEAVAEGWEISEISERLGVSEKYVRRRLREHGTGA
ncbi:helix-turn-helix domain-containing protein [Streptomyces sp. NPDC059740]|uniref:helix-turn-helix domain-containing protein n=1 Tax=Streptomyces sp. NPDC059740 TaxID=3346926 RepID=UPI00365451EB